MKPIFGSRTHEINEVNPPLEVKQIKKSSFEYQNQPINDFDVYKEYKLDDGADNNFSNRISMPYPLYHKNT